MSATNYMLLSADRVEPEQALAWGIVTEVVEPERLLPRAIEIAEMIAANAPLSVQGTKAAIQVWRQAQIEESNRLGEWIAKVVRDSPDSKEGANAVAKKLAPKRVGG